MKEMSLCKLVDTDYPLLCVCAPTYSVELYNIKLNTVSSILCIYFTFFALPLINFDILSGVDTK